MHAVSAVHHRFERGRVQFRASSRDRQQLAAAGEKLRRTALVGLDVGQLVAEDRVVALTQRTKHERIRRRAVEDKEHVAFALEEIVEATAGRSRVRIVAIARDVAGIGRLERRHRLETDPRGIVAREGKIGDGACHRIFRVWQYAGRSIEWTAHAMDPADVNLYLVGFMGTGKTTVGRAVAQRLGFTALDSDHEIERKQGKSIPDIFAQNGEAAFRIMEREFIEQGHGATRTLVACGGGLVVQPGMLDLLKTKGVVICLHASLETILDRTGRNRNRPLLAVDNPEERVRTLYAAREPIYKQSGTVILTDSRPLNDIAAHVLRAWRRDAADFVRAQR